MEKVIFRNTENDKSVIEVGNLKELLLNEPFVGLEEKVTESRYLICDEGECKGWAFAPGLYYSRTEIERKIKDGTCSIFVFDKRRELLKWMLKE
jgi:hypothetical protein